MSEHLRHGGMLDRMRAAFPNAPTPWVDLSTGINPWPWPVGTLDTAHLHSLPTQTAFDDCRMAMAHAFGVSPLNVLPAAGSELLIRLLPTVLDVRTVTILDPTYGDHAHVWTAGGAKVIQTNDPLAHAAASDVVILCNPNNPDGCRFNLTDIESARSSLANHGGWLVVDEAYADLDSAGSVAPMGGADGLIILRSFGKFFGLPGLRLGALVAPSDIIAGMSERLGVWGVSGMALHLGTAAYRDTEWQVATRHRLERARVRLDGILNNAGLEVLGGTDLFRFVRADDAQGLWRRLAESGIYVRRFETMPDHLRIGLPADDAAETRLTRALSL